VALYFFNSRDGSGTVSDADGTEVAGVPEAYARALILSGELLKEMAGRGTTSADLEVWVADELGTTVCSVSVHTACTAFPD
jgi:hypothetical protein